MQRDGANGRQAVIVPQLLSYLIATSSKSLSVSRYLIIKAIYVGEAIAAIPIRRGPRLLKDFYLTSFLLW